MSSATNSNTTDTSDCCESCSSSFSLFKRKKTCSYCRQSFCQFCVSRPKFVHQISNSNSDRICVTCQSIIEPKTSTDDLMKLKIKHLRSFLNTLDVPTSTCKDKRDLAELVIKSRIKLEKMQAQKQPHQQPTDHQSHNHSQTGFNSGTQNSNPNTNSFNDRFTGFMNNVQDFVNFNLNSVLTNQPVPCPPPQATSSQFDSQSSQGNVNTTTHTASSNQPTANSTYTSNSTSSSSSLPNNLNSVFNFIGEQLPNVINNNLFTFNTNNISTDSNHTIPNNNGQATSSTTNSYNSSNQNTTSSQPRSSTLNTDSTSTFSSSPPPPTNNPHMKRRASLSDLSSENDAENLSIKQIKEILASNFVEYRGCCEKQELVEKVKRLYKSNRENKRIEQELNETSNNSSNYRTQTNANKRPNDFCTDGHNDSNSNGISLNDVSENKQKRADESDLCKICMESIIDCVLLECGHMCSCIKCGKQLSECPICRQYVLKVIRVFKS